MTRTAAPVASAVVPLLLQAQAAAQLLGVSPTTLRTLPIPRRILGQRLIYHIDDIRRFADNLPYEGEATEAETCDHLFGLRK